MERKRGNNEVHVNDLEPQAAMKGSASLAVRKVDLVRSLIYVVVSVSLMPLVACGGDNPASQESNRSISEPRKLEPPVSPVVPIESGAKPASCPSKNFNKFLREFANRIEIQRAFTLRPIKVKTPYYWRHNTEPGDPRYPKWLTEASKVEMPNIKYRYDAEKAAYVWDEAKLVVGEPWSSHGPDGKARRVAPLPYFKIRKVSGERYEVDYIRSGTDSFVLNSGCWHFEQHWERENIVDCRWPDDCRNQREYEPELTGED
jgi:hypothetical protein